MVHNIILFLVVVMQLGRRIPRPGEASALLVTTFECLWMLTVVYLLREIWLYPRQPATRNYERSTVYRRLTDNQGPASDPQLRNLLLCGCLIVYPLTIASRVVSSLRAYSPEECRQNSDVLQALESNHSVTVPTSLTTRFAHASTHGTGLILSVSETRELERLDAQVGRTGDVVGASNVKARHAQ